MAELRPGDADAVVVDGHLVAVPLLEEIGGQVDHAGGVDGSAALHPPVHLQLEARQRGHDEEIAVEVRHGLLHQGQLEVGIVLRAEEVVPHQGLMEVGGHLGHEEGVVAIDVGLMRPGHEGVHRMAGLVRQRAEAEDVVGVAHEDEGLCVVGAAGEGALALAPVARPIDPAALQAALAQFVDVLLPQRGHALADPVDGLPVGDVGLLLRQRRLDVVDVELVVAQGLAADAPVAVPGGQVRLEDLDQVVEDLGGHVVGEERGLQRRVVPARAGVEDVTLEAPRLQPGDGVLEGQVGVGVVLPGGATHLPVHVGDQVVDAALPQLHLLAVLVAGGLEGQVGVGEHAVGVLGAAQRIRGQRQNLLDRGGAHVLLLALEILQVVAVDGQLGLLIEPVVEGVEPDGHQLGLDEGRRRGSLGAQAARLAGPRRGLLVRDVDRGGQHSVDDHSLGQAHELLHGIEAVEQGLRTFVQPPLETAQLGKPRLQLLAGRLPVGDGGEDALQVPGLLQGNLVTGWKGNF